jgi:hypothetical protein
MVNDNNSNDEKDSGSRLVKRSPQWDDAHYDKALTVAEKLKRPICGAHKRNGGICTQYPDASAGNGRCRFHGARAGRPIKHGVYSKRLTKSIKRDIFEDFLGDSELYELDAEIALLRTLLTDYINRCAELSSDTTRTADQVQQEATTCVRIIQAIARLQVCRDRLDKTGYVPFTSAVNEVEKHRFAFLTAGHVFLKDSKRFDEFVYYYLRELENQKDFQRYMSENDFAKALKKAAERVQATFK